MARPIALGSSRRALFLVAFGVLACTGLSGTVAFAQRGGGRVGGGVRVVAPRVVAPRTLVPRAFPRRLVYVCPGCKYSPYPPLGPISPIVIPPSFGFWGGPYFGYGLGFGLGPLWWQNCGFYAGYGCNPFPPYYIYGYGGDGRELAQLYLSDGTIYNVTDYWLVDNQLHFRTVEEGDTKVVEHTIDFNELDLQKTIDVNTQRGFHFVLRNEPIEDYLRDHPEIGAPSPLRGAPPAGPPPPSAPLASPQQPQ